MHPDKLGVGREKEGEREKGGESEMLQACCGDIEVMQVFTPNLGFWGLWDIILWKCLLWPLGQCEQKKSKWPTGQEIKLEC